MKTNLFSVTLLALTSAGLVCAGCQTQPQTGALGSAVGPNASAAPSDVPMKSPSSGTSANTEGFVAGDIVAYQTQDAKMTATAHNYKPGEGMFLVLDSEAVTPPAVAPGHAIAGTVQYSLLGAGPAGVTVTETRELTRNARLIGVSTQAVHRTDGTWVSTQDFQLPRDMLPGEYKLTQRVEAPHAKVAAGTVVFHVSESMAKLMPGENPAMTRDESRRPIYPPGYGPGPEGY